MANSPIDALQLTSLEQKPRRGVIAKARAMAPAVSVRIGSTAKASFRGDPDMFGRLVEDHHRHRGLSFMIEAAQGAGGSVALSVQRADARIEGARGGLGAGYVVLCLARPGDDRFCPPRCRRT